MVDDALAGLTLTELAAAIGAGKVSSLEATENCLAGLEIPVLKSMRSSP